MVGAGLSKLPCLGFLVLALLTHNMVDAMCTIDELRVNGGNVEVCRQNSSDKKKWTPLTCDEGRTDFNVTTFRTCLPGGGCTCPMTSSSPTTVTETLQITVIATLPTTVLEREVCTPSLTTVVHTETCSQIMPTKTITSSCPAMTTPIVSVGVLSQMEGATPPCAALGGGLGIVTGTLAILLVGVVIGWVWSCHRKRGKSHLEERDHTPKVASFQNPTYTLHEPRPSIQYSSSGPRDTPTSNTTPTTYDVIGGGTALGEGNYYMLGDEGVGHDYHVVEYEGEGHVYEEETALTYEVPLQSGTTPTPGEEYSTLHHK